MKMDLMHNISSSAVPLSVCGCIAKGEVCAYDKISVFNRLY